MSAHAQSAGLRAGASAPGWRTSSAHRAFLHAEAGAMLDFARGARVEQGFGWLQRDGSVDRTQPRQLWITARMTHVFALGALLDHPGAAGLVDHGLAALTGDFVDPVNAGWFAELTDSGPTRTSKEAYSHAFVVLAGASAMQAGRPGAEDLLRAALDVVDRRFWSETEGACVETWDREWSQCEPYRGANANMHMVEAFLAAADALNEPLWTDRALRIAARLVDDVARRSEWRIVEHFDAAWRPLPDYNAAKPNHPFRPFGVTPGHGLEWARLLLHARASVADPPAWLVDASRGLFERAVVDGWKAPGGFVYTTRLDGSPVVDARLHWVVAEAIAAASALHEITGEDIYERWYRIAWDAAEAHFRDRKAGSWHHELDTALQPTEDTWHGKPDVYHVLQATLIPLLPVTGSVAGGLRGGPPA